VPEKQNSATSSPGVDNRRSGLSEPSDRIREYRMFENRRSRGREIPSVLIRWRENATERVRRACNVAESGARNYRPAGARIIIFMAETIKRARNRRNKHATEVVRRRR